MEAQRAGISREVWIEGVRFIELWLGQAFSGYSMECPHHTQSGCKRDLTWRTDRMLGADDESKQAEARRRLLAWVSAGAAGCDEIEHARLAAPQLLRIFALPGLSF